MRLQPTTHAVHRYVDRVKPCLTFEAAKAEIEALLNMTPKLTPIGPDWLAEAHSETEAYVELADGIVGAVKGHLVTTVLTRGGACPETRQRRNERKAKRKADRKKAARLISTRSGRSEPRNRKEASWDR